jgi:hypothetical protein
MQRGTVVYESDVAGIDQERLAAELGIGKLLRPSTNGHRPKARTRSGPRRSRPLKAR